MTLEEVVKRCRALGITRYRGELEEGPLVSEVEIDIGPEPVKPVTEIDIPREVKKVLVKPGVLGADGLTAEQQFDFYGAVRDAIPPEYEE